MNPPNLQLGSKTGSVDALKSQCLAQPIQPLQDPTLKDVMRELERLQCLTRLCLDHLTYDQIRIGSKTWHVASLPPVQPDTNLPSTSGSPSQESPASEKTGIWSTSRSGELPSTTPPSKTPSKPSLREEMPQKDLEPGMTVRDRIEAMHVLLVQRIPHDMIRIPGWHMGHEGDLTPNTRGNKWLVVKVPLDGSWPIQLMAWVPANVMTKDDYQVYDQRGDRIL